MDLVETLHNSDISLTDVLAGLEYVMDYRIKGGKMLNLDLDLMRRLLTGLLQNMTHRTGNLLSKSFTPEAHLSFVLFGDFLQEVIEFREAVNSTATSDLQFALKLHKRVGVSKQQDEVVANIISLILKHCPLIQDWKELVKASEEDTIEDLIKDFPDCFKTPAMDTDKVPFPPQGTHLLIKLQLFILIKIQNNVQPCFHLVLNQDWIQAWLKN